MSGIYPHNSDKCHCPECEKVRGQVRDLARTEIKHADFDKAVRRTQRMISPVGRIRFPSLSYRDEALRDEALHVKRERMTWRDRVYYSKRDECHWRWKHFPGSGWARTNVKNGTPFGEYFRDVTFTPTGYSARCHRRPWRDQAPITMRLDEMTSRSVGRAIGATEHTVTHKVGAMEETVTDRVEFACKPPLYGLAHWTDHGGFVGGGAKTGADVENAPINLEQEKPVLNTLQLSILLFRAAHVHKPYPRNSLGVSSTMLGLEKLGLIEIDMGTQGEYTLTARAQVLVEAIKALPLPVKPEPAWEMPS